MNTDLEYIEKAALERKAENQGFANKIKTISVSEFDRLAKPAIQHVTAQIDCTACGNCCREQEPGVSAKEIKKLAELNSKTEEEFKNEQIGYDKNGTAFLCQQPCAFLDGNKCSIYNNRPGSCADYPGLERPNLKWRWKQVMENYTICPIVFNVVEELKKV